MKSAVSIAKSAAAKRHTSLCGFAQYNKSPPLSKNRLTGELFLFTY